MSKVLVLAASGFGKSTSIGNIPELGITGLDPAVTFLVSTTTKDLPFKGSRATYPVCLPGDLKSGKRANTDNPQALVTILNQLVQSPFQNIVLDDFNYIMQNWYMANALSKGWDAPKTIGFFMGQIFDAIEALDREGKNVFVLAHGEPVTGPDGRVYLKLKTTGKMVDEYVTPEGKFTVVLLGISEYDTNTKQVKKRFLTNENESYSSAKSPIGMFPELFIPNDLGFVVEKMAEYYG